MANGYWNRILRVDLTSQKVSVDEHDAKFYRRYLGGRGIIAHYLLTELQPGCDPLGPDNMLVFAASVLTGTGTPGAGRNSVGARSPLTGGYGDAEAGGDWGVKLRWAGYDGIVVTGASASPVYLWITNDIVEIRDASLLWGCDTLATETAVRQDVGDDTAAVAMIGPGGERLVRFACINFGLHDYAGRCGLGAVMGAKQLKAIAVQGKTRPAVADGKAVIDSARWLRDNYEATLGSMKELGTARGVPSLNLSGALPTRNFRDGSFDGYETISGRYMTDTILVDRDACYACPVHCKRVVEINDGDMQVKREYGGPEYETVGAFGSACCISDIKIVAKANEMCNAASLDTISAGVIIAGALECAEKGLLPPHLTEGLDLRFGSAQGVLGLLQQIIERRALGAILGEGPMRAAQILGAETGRYFLHVKGQPLPLHEPRWKTGLGLGYALSTTGADHMHNMHDPALENEDAPGFAVVRSLGVLDAVPTLELSPAKARLWLYFVLQRWISNNVDMCAFLPYSLAQIRDLVHAVTGWDVTDWELMKTAERAMAMTRVFNVREGFKPGDDTLPDRFFEALENGALKGVAIKREPFFAARDLIYDMLGWNKATGAVEDWKLYELDLDWLAGTQGQ